MNLVSTWTNNYAVPGGGWEPAEWWFIGCMCKFIHYIPHLYRYCIQCVCGWFSSMGNFHFLQFPAVTRFPLSARRVCDGLFFQFVLILSPTQAPILYVPAHSPRAVNAFIMGLRQQKNKRRAFGKSEIRIKRRQNARKTTRNASKIQYTYSNTIQIPAALLK